jgi:hypothetical protein
MNISKHSIMTFVALCFLGVIISKPGEAFQSNEIEKVERECVLLKGKMDCENKLKNKHQPTKELNLHLNFRRN